MEIIYKIFNKLYRNWFLIHLKKRTGQKAKVLGRINLWNENLECGSDVILYPDVTFWGNGLIKLGNSVSIGNGTIIYSSKTNGMLEIGNNVFIAAQCYIIDMDHGIKKDALIKDQKNSYGKIKIGNDVWIGAGAKILRGTILGDGCVVGANAVVKGVFPSNSIIVGNPGRILKKRE